MYIAEVLIMYTTIPTIHCCYFYDHIFIMHRRRGIFLILKIGFVSIWITFVEKWCRHAINLYLGHFELTTHPSYYVQLSLKIFTFFTIFWSFKSHFSTVLFRWWIFEWWLTCIDNQPPITVYQSTCNDNTIKTNHYGLHYNPPSCS